ncbi:MAG: nucleotidyltransferase domain-containing protein [Deltaproteobacteria bacterium]|nr:nucleotidyltransferase domain-containing protein [Deltaproteobacteria bacterium]
MRDDALYKLKYLTDAEKTAIRIFEADIRHKLSRDIILLEVFGSKVRGDYKPESDIDVLVLVKKITTQVMEKIAAVSSDISIEQGVLISAVVLSEREYNKNRDSNTLFVQEINRDGIVLYAA